MHLLATTSTTLDEIVEPVDLGQPPGDVVVLSFADSDLSGLAAAWAMERDALPSVRLAHLRDLRHPMSVDLWIDRVGAHAKVILVRLLGGLDWWRYGVERLSALARERGDRARAAAGRGPRRSAARARRRPCRRMSSTRCCASSARADARTCARCCDGSPAMPAHASMRPSRNRFRAWPAICPAPARSSSTGSPRSLRPAGRWCRSSSIGRCCSRPIPLPIDALCEALAARGLAPAPLVITSLKETATRRNSSAPRWRGSSPAVVLTTTAFAAGGEPGEPTPLDGPDVPVLQVVIATTKRAAWRDSARGLGAADLAMHVVLPELDGRVLAGAIAFKDPLPPQDGLAFTALANRPEPDRIAFVADRVAALARLRTTPRSERRVAILLPDYPGAPGRTGYAVGLDVPASVLALLADLGEAGYAVRDAPQTPRALLDALRCGLGRCRAVARQLRAPAR